MNSEGLNIQGFAKFLAFAEYAIACIQVHAPYEIVI